MAMKRQKKYTQHFDDATDFLPMQRVPQTQSKFENTIEAQVQDGDTLQALALRFHCSVADIKRLNKIDKDNEIHARKVVKIPVTVHSVLLETLPTVHKSGNNSPKHPQGSEKNNVRNSLENDILSEKLLVASVNSAGDTINDIILKSSVRNNAYKDDSVEDNTFSMSNNHSDHYEPLMSGYLDDSIPQPRIIPGPAVRPWDWSGSDCDMSWVCLFIVILALCFAIPLIYVFYIAEHPKKIHHSAL
ncbi:lysM and putative peptidoglycan-binding domain-containing protein 4 [Episyrphus balteatus]|uniref:lysM and putative peptidoglycan-binding domain-containing protein 4 n=1 Tax=Episyrphus balteatus TaxID=286459 RepID=UPI0024865967|nr:lysM and putative peptidoglycan-binding domain-containing protein 4 [Episyrphus balteatus]